MIALLKGRHGAGAEPHVPVEIGRDGFGEEIAFVGRARHAEVDVFYFADVAIADEFDGVAKRAGGALLRAGLEDAVVAADGFDQFLGFANGEGEGFFAVDVFAGFGGGDCDEGVPVVGRGDGGLRRCLFGRGVR